MDQLDIPPNPTYGDGFFLRALRITAPRPGEILLGMEDMGHAFQIRFTHDGTVVTALEARWHRHPVSTCPGAPDALQALVGCPLGDSVLAPQQFTDPLQQCTHFFDMMRLGMVHAWHGRPDRYYEVVIADAPSGPQTGELYQDGQLRLALSVNGDVIEAPERWRGASLTRGFGHWAKTHLDPETLEQVFMLQRSFFIAHGRRGDYSALSDQRASLSGLPEGVCYASRPAHYAQALRLNTIRDYSKIPEQVLNFFPLPDQPRHGD